jgi:hypothetical protein
MDDWTGGFTGLVDLDRQMRELAMAESGVSDLDSDRDDDSTYLHSPSLSNAPHRTKGSADTRLDVSAPSSPAMAARGLSTLSNSSGFHAPSFASTAATSLFSCTRSGSQPSLASKKRTSANRDAAPVDSLGALHRVASLPAADSVFGSYHLAEQYDLSLPANRSGLLSLPHWSTVDFAASSLPTPGAASWTDSDAPRFFRAGLPIGTKTVRSKPKRAPLPRLISGEIPSSVSAGSRAHGTKGSSDEDVAHPTQWLSEPSASSAPNMYALRRSAQSLAIGLRFKVVRAKRKMRKTGHEAAHLFAPTRTFDRPSQPNVAT